MTDEYTTNAREIIDAAQWNLDNIIDGVDEAERESFQAVIDLAARQLGGLNFYRLRGDK